MKYRCSSQSELTVGIDYTTSLPYADISFYDK